MRQPPPRQHHCIVSTSTETAPTIRRAYRRPDIGVLGGVAAGLAEHMGVRAKPLRICFILLSAAGGLGIALYGAYWIVLPTPPGVRPRLPVWLEYAVGGVAALVAVGIVATSLPAGGLVIPTVLACLGGALIWRQASDTQRVRLRALSRDSLVAGATERSGRARIVVGAALVAAGGALVLLRANFSAIRDGALAMVVAVVGIAIITGPWWMRLVAQLTEERTERIRSQERADLAAHLHDSVLQTLALIQRNAEAPREVARLARGQERELRTWLYRPENRQESKLAAALEAVAGEVEDAYVVQVESVVVGDAEVDDRLGAVV